MELYIYLIHSSVTHLGTVDTLILHYLLADKLRATGVQCPPIFSLDEL